MILCGFYSGFNFIYFNTLNSLLFVFMLPWSEKRFAAVYLRLQNKTFEPFKKLENKVLFPTQSTMHFYNKKL